MVALSSLGGVVYVLVVMTFKAFGWELSVHEEGRSYVWIGLAVTLLLLIGTGFSFLALLSLVVTLGVAGFFRNPERIVPTKEGAVVSPADGVVIGIDVVKPLASMDLGEAEMKRVMIFLSVFDVHINRVPIAGRILKVEHVSGKFEHAGKPKSTDHNEHNLVVLESESGKRISFVQIAGFVARRIVCDAEEGDFYATGERYGLIKFGSRVDLYLPQDCQIEVSVGQRMIGGETIITKI